MLRDAATSRLHWIDLLVAEIHCGIVAPHRHCGLDVAVGPSRSMLTTADSF